LYRELGVPVFENVEPKGPNDQMKILLLVNDIPKAIRLWETEKENLGILIKTVASYLEKNASPELISAVLKRVPSDNKLIVKAFFSQIQKGNLSGVRAFVENGVSLNATDWKNASALFSSVMNRKIEIVKYLVENGADIHSKTYPGYTPFSYAEGLRRSGVTEISNYLREADALREREEKAKGKELGK
ncbi:MAG: ankyrin repeat domain-containing protein, partial [Opitutales bacterium]|nr:ankyrin repeat domain-containing protein [Opitutales bacterium]